MNELGRDKLREAALKGVNQIKRLGSGNNLCALGVLMEATSSEDKKLSVYRWMEVWGLSRSPQKCIICGIIRHDEFEYIIHLNDVHELDFLAIANKV